MKSRKWMTAALLIASATALAQGGPPPGLPGRGLGPRAAERRGADRTNEDARKMVETLMLARLSRELNLNDEETVLMVRRIEEFKERIGAKKKERGELAKALRASVESGAPEEEIRAKTQQLMEADRAVADTRFGLFEEASKGLNAAQAAKLYVFLSEFEDQMRKLVQKARVRAAGAKAAFQEPGSEGPVSPGAAIRPRLNRARRVLPPEGAGGQRRNRAARRGADWEPLDEAPENPPPPASETVQ